MVVFHGENHTNIDDAHYFNQEFNPDDVILVEHSTNACEIKPEEEHLFEQYARGTEYIFYTQKKSKNTNVICFDTRAEHGYLNAFQEKRLLELGLKLDAASPEEVKEFIDGALRSLTVVANSEDWFEKVLPGYHGEAIATLKSQLQVCIHLLKMKKVKGVKFALSQVLSGIGQTLAANIRRVGSVSTDVGLAMLLMRLSADMKRGTTIHVFCGRNHVVRMSQILPFKKKGVFDREQLVTAVMELDGDLEADKSLLAMSES